MKATGWAGRSNLAFRRTDRGDGGTASYGPQLRLVAEEGKPAGPLRASRVSARDAGVLGQTTSRVASESLADYLIGLAAGDDCFCCGAALVRGEDQGDWSEGQAGGLHRCLECPSCGASLEGP
ncbi:MAG: hypothetical protein ACYC6T_06325 [Thermoleophilia bacterium]